MNIANMRVQFANMRIRICQHGKKNRTDILNFKFKFRKIKQY